MIILGIDPGTQRIGYGVIQVDGNRVSFVAAGLLPNISHSNDIQLLGSIRTQTDILLRAHTPDIVAIETLFFSKNQKTGIAVAQARGAILATVTAHCSRVCEFSPTTIKSTITGSGAADKRAVSKMVGLILRADMNSFIDDAVDALAIALCAQQHLHTHHKEHGLQ